MKALFDRVPAARAGLGVVFIAALIALCPLVFGTWTDAQQAQQTQPTASAATAQGGLLRGLPHV